MSKLTAEQKALNKQATSLRNKAYNARSKVYREALEAAEAKVAASKEAAELQEAQEAAEAAAAVREAEMQALQAKIRELQEQQEALAKAHLAQNRELRTVTSEKHSAYYKLLNEKKQEVNALYPDIVASQYSAAMWRPITDFLEEAEALMASDK